MATKAPHGAIQYTHNLFQSQAINKGSLVKNKVRTSQYLQATANGHSALCMHSAYLSLPLECAVRERRAQ